LNYDFFYNAPGVIDYAHKAFAVKMLGPADAGVGRADLTQMVMDGLLSADQAQYGYLIPLAYVGPILMAVLMGSKTAQDGVSRTKPAKPWGQAVRQGAKSLVGWAKEVASMVVKRAGAKKRQPGIPDYLTDAEVRAWKFAKDRAGQQITKASAEMKDRVRELTQKAIENRWSKEKFTSELEAVFSKQTRNWATVARTELQYAFNEGVVAAAEDKFGTGARIAFLPEPDACDVCKELFLDEEGKPKVFFASQLRANGSNAGKKKNEMLPTVGPPHPNCRCRPISLGENEDVPLNWGSDLYKAESRVLDVMSTVIW
jgi:hypothetical protein